ncbi:hypothetical protein SV7mr_23270 [Stieleria bergensis]|uniref:Uncharacterized protein n=1 Tax=Stieleria bergensis TaxID=2528025 RepID=A0A517SUL0_9BACT|nr:hypothetical protein SV7mr_23270 [Planctomycetes bacterium SV_7m_r]
MRQHSSTDLCGGRPETAVPTVTEVVGNANRLRLPDVGMIQTP